jgi:hypothetical protein
MRFKIKLLVFYKDFKPRKPYIYFTLITSREYNNRRFYLVYIPKVGIRLEQVAIDRIVYVSPIDVPFIPRKD